MNSFNTHPADENRRVFLPLHFTYRDMKLLNKLRSHPLQVINYTELLFAFVAHVVTIPYIGVLTGLICGCAVHYTIQIQQDGKKPATRQRAFWGTLCFKTGQLWIHQTSFLFMFTVSGKTLPFGWALDTWAWITTVFIFSIDVWALSVTSQEAAERAEAAEVEESFARVQAREEADRRERAERAERNARERIETARIKAEAKKTAQLAAEETRRKEVEEQRKIEEERRKADGIRAELEWKKVELQRKAEEDERNAAELRRKEEEAERKEAERLRKQEEREEKEKQAKIRAESEAAQKEARRKEEEEKEALRAKWRAQKQRKTGGQPAEPQPAENEA